MQTNLIVKKSRILLVILLLITGKYCNAQFSGTFTFDGSTQSISTPVGMLNGKTVFTIEFWVKTTESRTNSTYWQQPTLIGVATNGGPSGDFGIITSGGFLGMWSGLNSSGDNSVLSSTKINDNNWHHIAAVNNGTSITLFADGISVCSLASGLGLGTSTAPLTIGAAALDFSQAGNIGTSNFFHQGIFDEVRFSSTVRYTSNFAVPSSAFTTDANAVALYHLDGCVSELVPDASANANNAKPYNFTGACAFTLPSPPTIPVNSVAGTVQKAEYFFDTDPGFGNATSITVGASADINSLIASVNTSTLSNGAHRIYVRTQNAAKNWSLTNSGAFFIVPPSVTLPAGSAVNQITKAEYFFDTDPGFSNGTAIPITATLDLNGFVATVNTSTLGNGVHRIYLRTQDASKHWSITNVASFYIVQGAPTIAAANAATNIVKAEYFLDTDPGFGKATDIPLTASKDITLNNAFINLTGLSDGVHHVYVRTKDASNNWSITNNSVFSIVAATVSIPSNPSIGNITKLEYFFDTDPGFGKGTIVTITPTTNLNSYTIAADVSSLKMDTIHTLYVRSFDGWSLTTTKTFSIGTPLPVSWISFNARSLVDSVVLNWVTTNEKNDSYFEVERSADGKLFKKIGVTPATINPSTIDTYQYGDNNPLTGISYYRLKQVDKDGQYNYSVIIAVRFAKNGDDICVYPNPADDKLTVSFKQIPQGDIELQLIGASGQLLQRVSGKGLQQKVLNVANLANGIYQLHIISDKINIVKAIVVQH